MRSEVVPISPNLGVPNPQIRPSKVQAHHMKSRKRYRIEDSDEEADRLATRLFPRNKLLTQYQNTCLKQSA